MAKTSFKPKISFTLPTLNQFSSRKEWEEACWALVSKSDKLLSALTTFYERHNIVLRALVVEYLNSGKTNRKIAEELDISRQTISSIKKTLDSHIYKSYRERGKSERKRKVYSRNLNQKKQKPHGRRIRTKYGVLHLS